MDWNAALVFLTVILIAVTAWYAVATWRLLAEAQRTREATFWPYVHAHVTRLSTGTNLANVAVVLELANFWNGPALGVRGYLHHDYLRFHSTPHAVDIGHGDLREVRFEKPGVAGIEPGQSVAKLWLEYRDLLGKKWATAVQILVGVSSGEDGAGRRYLSVTGMNIIEDSERVFPINCFHIAQLRLRSDDKGIPWPNDWTSPLEKPKL